MVVNVHSHGFLLSACDETPEVKLWQLSGPIYLIRIMLVWIVSSIATDQGVPVSVTGEKSLNGIYNGFNTLGLLSLPGVMAVEFNLAIESNVEKTQRYTTDFSHENHVRTMLK